MKGSRRGSRRELGRGGLALLLGCAVAASGCADPEVEQGPVRIDPFEGMGGVGALDALSRRFGRVRHRMVERGYGEELGLARVFVLENEGRAVPADLVTDACTTFVALGGGAIRDLALTVYDGEGEEVAADTVPGEGALVHVCPQATAAEPTLPYYLVVQSREGSGAVVAGAFLSPPGEGEGFEALFDGVLAPHVPFRAVEEQLARSRSLLRARGLLPVGEPTIESVAEGEGIRIPIAMDAGRCYVVIGRGGEGLVDIDLLLYDSAGAEVARDLEGDAEPSLEHCPEEPGRYTAEVSAYEGAGALGVMLLAGPVPEEGAGEPPAATEPPSEEPDREAASDGTDPVTAVTNVASGLASRGYDAPMFVVRDGYIAPGEVRTHEVLMGPGCAVVLGAVGRSETDLDLYLSDREGHTLDRDTGVQPTARVRACPEEPSVMRVTVKSYGRRGGYALAVLRAPDDISDVRALRLEEASAGLIERGYTSTDRLEVQLDQGERVERGMVVRPGTCLAIAAAGDVGVEDLDLFLRDARGRLVASATGPEPYAAVSRCAEEEPQTLKVQVLMYRGSGTAQLDRMEVAR